MYAKGTEASEIHQELVFVHRENFAIKETGLFMV
jgi:hypothetical protein